MPSATQDNTSLLLSKLYREGAGNVESVLSGTAVTISPPSTATTTVLTLNGTTPAITLPAPTQGAAKTLVLVQDATGSRIPSWVATSGAIKWVGAAAPTLQTAAAAVDAVDFKSFDGINWYGSAKLHIA